MVKVEGVDLSRYRAPTRRFFSRDTLTVAKALLGAYLQHDLPKGRVGGVVVEAEAYVMFDDPGCHAFRGKTERNRAMFGPPGHAYTYFTYGNHWMFNIVTEREGHGCAVLIRALEPMEGLEIMRARRPKARRDVDLANGPGKLAAALGIGKEQYGLDLLDSPLRVFVPRPYDRARMLRSYGGVVQTTRIGLNNGGNLPYRFYLADHPCVSARRRRGE